MEQYKNDIANTNDKIEKIRNFIALSLRREHVSIEARQILTEAESVRHDIEEANRILKNEYERLDKDYEAVVARMQNQQARILDYVIEERKRKLDEAQHIRQVLRKHKNQKLKQKNVKDLSHAISKKYKPKVNISKTHFEKRAMPTPHIKPKINLINFLNFDIFLLGEKFDRIPKYMRGRETFAELSQFLESVIIPCFNEKYELLERKSITLHGPDLELYNLYKKQLGYVPDRNFITIGDISRKMNNLLGKKTLNRMVMLRHMGLLQEQRIGPTICYIWNK